MKETIFKSLIVLLSFSLILFIFAPVLKLSFMYDDIVLITENNFFKSHNIFKLFSSQLTSQRIRQDMFRPLTMATFYLNYRLGGNNPWGYHLFNLILISLNALLLFFILVRFFPKIEPWLIIVSLILFLLAPFNNQASFYISARFTLLFSFFYLLAFYFYIKRRLLWCLVVFIFGVFSKEEMLSLPLVLFCYELSRDRDWKYYYKSLFGFVFCAVLFLEVRFLFSDKFILYDTNYTRINWDYLPQEVGFFFYNIFSSFSSPVIIHDLRAINLFLPSLLAVAFLLAAIYLIAKRHLLGFLLIYPFIFIISFALFLNAPYRAMEYRYYLANTFYLILLLSFLNLVAERIKKSSLITVYALGIFVCFFFSFYRVSYYKPLVLWKNTVERYPCLAEARINYGRILTQRGLYKESIREYKKALDLNPDNYFAYYNLGCALAFSERFFPAEKAFKKAIQLAPFYAPAHYNLGLTYFFLGDKIKAGEEFIRARELGYKLGKLPELK